MKLPPHFAIEKIYLFLRTYFFSFYCCYFNFKYSSSTHSWNRVKKFRYLFESPTYQLDPSNIMKERKNGIFLKSYRLSKNSKDVPLPFLKTLLDSFLCDETNESNALMPSLSRPKSSRDWHPHLPSYVSEPTNLNSTFQYNINRK